jgi:hypothetical protein
LTSSSDLLVPPVTSTTTLDSPRRRTVMIGSSSTGGTAVPASSDDAFLSGFDAYSEARQAGLRDLWRAQDWEAVMRARLTVQTPENKVRLWFKTDGDRKRKRQLLLDISAYSALLEHDHLEIDSKLELDPLIVQDLLDAVVAAPEEAQRAVAKAEAETEQQLVVAAGRAGSRQTEACVPRRR